MAIQLKVQSQVFKTFSGIIQHMAMFSLYVLLISECEIRKQKTI